MRPLTALLLVVILGGCSTGHDSGAGPPSSGTPPSAPSSGPPDAPPSAVPSAPPVGPQPDRSGTPACAEVRAGIDAFNTGDFDGTVAHFRTALPLARAQAAADGSASARDLLAAVRYYADLAPSDYLRSAASSPQFARYKAITLGQCVASSTEPPRSPSSQSPGVTT